MSSAPCFAVLLCSHNGAPYLPQQLASLDEQGPMLRYVDLHDWCSRDDSAAILQAWAAGPERSAEIAVSRHERAPGACASFLQGLEACLRRFPDASHILFCDQDDRWAPSKLAAYAAALGNVESPPDLLFSDVRLVDAQGGVIADSFYGTAGSPYRPVVGLASPDLALVNPAIGMTLCLSRRLAEALCRSAAAPWAMHDWAATMLCQLHGWPSQFLPQVFADYRQHAGNVRGAPGFSRLGLKVRRMRQRYRDLRHLRRWALALEPDQRSRALALIPAGRVDAAGRLLRSRNLRAPHRALLALAAILLW